MGVAAAVVLGAAYFASAAEAAPAPIVCGQTITASTVLTADIGPCASDGIIIGADNITLRLNGHTISGIPGPDNNAGIHLIGKTGVTVGGGTVTDFGAGVAIMGGSSNSVLQMTLRDNVGLLDGSGDFGDGLFIQNSADNILANSRVRHNGPFEGVGVFGNGKPAKCENPIVNNDQTLPQDLQDLVCQLGGIGTPNPTQNNVIRDNVIENNDIARSEGFIRDSGINLGVGLDGGSHTSIIRNTIRGNGLDGISACSIFGNPCFTDYNVIRSNVIVGNGFASAESPLHEPGHGIDAVTQFDVPRAGTVHFPVHTLISNNIIRRNAGTGLFVADSKYGIHDNTIVDNGSGVVIPDPANSNSFDFALIIFRTGMPVCDSDSNIRGNVFGTVASDSARIQCLVDAGNIVRNRNPFPSP